MKCNYKKCKSKIKEVPKRSRNLKELNIQDIDVKDYLKDYRLLKTIAVHERSMARYIIESINAQEKNGVIKITYDYDDYPYVFGRDTIEMTVDEFKKMIVKYKGE